MRVGGHFSYFIIQLIALLEQSDCSISVFRSEIPIMKFHAGAFRSMRVVTINSESTWPGLSWFKLCQLVTLVHHVSVNINYFTSENHDSIGLVSWHVNKK